MASPQDNKDLALVAQCLSGSELAWLEFYVRYQRLVRMVVKMRLRVSEEGVEDVVQEVFISLLSALKTYDTSCSIQNFVCIIAGRVCVDQYRFSTAAKRYAETESFDDQATVLAGCMMDGPQKGHQEEELIRLEQSDITRRALRLLGAKCRELLKLRYYEELPYGKITKIFGAAENALTVQSSRCIRELRDIYQSLVNKAARQ